MIASARALALLEPLHVALKDLESVVHRRPEFDPFVDTRQFVIAASDNATSTLGMSLLERLSVVAGTGCAWRSCMDGRPRSPPSSNRVKSIC
jgi:hypothetical protein